jgi:hypothetical protein
LLLLVAIAGIIDQNFVPVGQNPRKATNLKGTGICTDKDHSITQFLAFEKIADRRIAFR